jgi:hypothetical protein
MQLGTTAWVCQEAFIVDKNRQVYLIEDPKWPSPSPRFVGPGYAYNHICVTRTEKGYILEETLVPKCKECNCKEEEVEKYQKTLVYARLDQGLILLKIAQDPTQNLWYRIGIDEMNVSLFSLKQVLCLFRKLLERPIKSLVKEKKLQLISKSIITSMGLSSRPWPFSMECSDMVFVKWIQSNGESLYYPTRELNYLTSKRLKAKSFDYSTKICSEGIHLLSLEDAVEYLFQERLTDKLGELSLVLCQIPASTSVVTDDGKIRAAEVEKVAVVEMKDLKHNLLHVLPNLGKHIFQLQEKPSPLLTLGELRILSFWLAANSLTPLYWVMIDHWRKALIKFSLGV